MIEQLKIIISAEIDNLRSSVREAREEISSLSRTSGMSSKEIDSAVQSIGNKTSAAMKTMGVAVAGGATALLGLSAATEEYRTGQAKLQTAFEAVGSSVETAKNTYNDLYRVLGDSDVAVEASGHLAQLTTDQKSLSEWTDICQGVYATFGDSLPIESLTEAANETAKTGSLTGALADALNWAGINEEQFQEKLDACNTEAEREALIRETLNGTYQEAAQIYEANNKATLEQNEAQAKLQETTAALGEAMTPFLTTITELGTQLLTAVAPAIQDFATNYGPQLKEVLTVVAELVGKILGFVAEHWGILVGMAAVIGGIAAAVGIYNAVAAVKAAMDAAQVSTIWALVSAYAAQAVAVIAAIAPYVLIVAAIAAVIAIIVLCIKHWDEITKFIGECWTKIKEWTANAVDAIGKKFTEMKEAISNKVNEIKETVSQKFNEFKTNAVNRITELKTATINKFTELKNGAIQKATEVLNGVSEKFGAIKEKISSYINGARDAVKSAIDKMKSFFKFEWSLPKIKLPHFSISGKFSLNPPSIPHFSVDWYKLGGVFDKPTLFNYSGGIGGLGEDGAEAIVPLEKNTQWIDKLAAKLSSKQGTTPIILQVDGKTFARVSVDSINQLTRQTGNFPLKMA